MNVLQELWGLMKGWFNAPLFEIGTAPVTLWTITSLIVLFIMLLWSTQKLKSWVVLTLLANSTIDIGVRQATGSIVRYTVIAIGFVVILQSVGIDLSTVTVLAGALGIGVGFGLQTITNNLVSGLILLFERPIKIGDRIEVGQVTGDVVDISARATTVITNDNIAIIITERRVHQFQSDQLELYDEGRAIQLLRAGFLSRGSGTDTPSLTGGGTRSSRSAQREEAGRAVSGVRRKFPAVHPPRMDTGLHRPSGGAQKRTVLCHQQNIPRARRRDSLSPARHTHQGRQSDGHDARAADFVLRSRSARGLFFFQSPRTIGGQSMDGKCGDPIPTGERLSGQRARP